MLLLRAARPRGGEDWANALRCWLPVVLLAGLMVQAWWNESGTRLTASIDRFSIPAAAAPRGGSPGLLFRVGDRSQNSDLIVRPYLKAHLNRLFDGDPPREFVRVEAVRSPTDPAALRVRLVLLSYAGKPAEDLPGMHVTVGINPCAVDFAPRRELDLKPGKDALVRIYRDNFEGSCAGAKQTRFAERRSFTVTHIAAQGTLPARIEISFAQPLRTDAGSCFNPRDILIPASDERALPPGYLLPRNLEFGSLGAGGADHPRAVLASDAIGPAPGEAERCDENSPPVRWPENAAADRTSLTLDFDYLTLPWILLWLTLGAAGGAWLFGREAQRSSPAERIAMPLLLYLLALRTMTAIAGASYDLQIDPAEFYRDAAVAMIAVPPLLAVLIRPAALASRDLWLRWLALTLALTFAAALWFGLPWLSGEAALMLLIPAALLVPQVRLRWWLAGVTMLLVANWKWDWFAFSFDLAILVLAWCGMTLRARLDGVNPLRAWYDRAFAGGDAGQTAQPRWYGSGLKVLTLQDRSLTRRISSLFRHRPDWQRRAIGGVTMFAALVPYWLADRLIGPGAARVALVLGGVLVVVAVLVLAFGAIVTFRDVIRAVLVNRSSRFNVAIVALLIIGIVRWSMGMIGWRERISGTIPMSMAYLPAVILLSALAIAGLLSFRRYPVWGALIASGAIGFAALAVPYMVHDSGFALVHLFPLVGVAIYHLWRGGWHRDHVRSVTAIMAAPALALVLGLLATTLLSVRDLPADNAKLAEAMNAALEFDANELRLVQIVRPTAIEQVGTRAGYDQMEQTAMLHSLTSSFVGAGWLAPVELLSIRKEQTWDYGAAVHLMHPFGRIGLLAFLLVIAAATLALFRARDEGGGGAGFLTIAGEMAAVTLLFSAVYIALGNLLLIPFTGRNLYLLAVLSVGDLIEGLTLLALSVLLLVGTRR